MVNTDQDKGWGLTPPPFPQRSCVTIVTSPGHVPPIVEPYSPGSATHPVRGQMSHRPLAPVTTLQLSASDPNKHWNKLRDGERGEDDDKINHIYSTNLHDHIRVQVILTKSVLSAVQFSGGDVQCRGDFLCMLQYVSLLWWSMIVWNFYILCGLGLQWWNKNAQYGDILVAEGLMPHMSLFLCFPSIPTLHTQTIIVMVSSEEVLHEKMLFDSYLTLGSCHFTCTSHSCSHKADKTFYQTLCLIIK